MITHLEVREEVNQMHAASIATITERRTYVKWFGSLQSPPFRVHHEDSLVWWYPFSLGLFLPRTEFGFRREQIYLVVRVGHVCSSVPKIATADLRPNANASSMFL